LTVTDTTVEGVEIAKIAAMTEASRWWLFHGSEPKV
jgi:hypothetical protein